VAAREGPVCACALARSERSKMNVQQPRRNVDSIGSLGWGCIIEEQGRGLSVP
jgi:hypothetical protein